MFPRLRVSPAWYQMTPGFVINGWKLRGGGGGEGGRVGGVGGWLGGKGGCNVSLNQIHPCSDSCCYIRVDFHFG